MQIASIIQDYTFELPKIVNPLNRRQYVLSEFIERVERANNKSVNKARFAIRFSSYSTDQLEEILHMGRNKDDLSFTKWIYWLTKK